MQASTGSPSWEACDSPHVTNTGSDLSFNIHFGYYNDHRYISTHYTVTCLGADKQTYVLNDIATAMTIYASGDNIGQNVGCGDGQVIAYTLEPLTLDNLKASATPLAAGDYTASGSFHWDAGVDGFPVLGSINSPKITNGGSDLSFNVYFGYYSNGKQTSTHYTLTCLGADLKTYQVNDVATAMTTYASGGNVSQTASCGAGSQITAYTLEPLHPGRTQGVSKSALGR